MKATKSYLLMQCFLFYIIQSCNCEGPFPDKMHIISRVYTKSSNPEDLSDILYLSDEFVDITGGISSLRLTNLQESQISIYYNELEQKKSLVYDDNLGKCLPLLYYDMPLARLRHILIAMLPIGKLDRNLIDIARGPSILLLGISKTLEKFRFITTTYSGINLSDVDVYEYVLNFNDQYIGTLTRNKKLILTVSVLRSENKNLTSNNTLADLKKENFDIVSIEACNVAKSELGYRLPNTIYTCSRENTLFHIAYYSLAEMTTGTIIGQGLEQSTDFNFDREPFMQPIGIGCWSQELGCFGEKKFMAPLLQFSGAYKATNGSFGFSYVAYDGYRKILRLDKDGRKSIYDLESFTSYHVGEFLSSKEKSISTKMAKNCILLKIESESMKNINMLENLLGISTTKHACHLGYKMVDHLNYEVYETELNYGRGGIDGYNMPILLETTLFVMPNVYDEDKRYFITYYVHDYPFVPDTNGFNEFAYSQQQEQTKRDSIPMLKFIELWETSKSTQSRRLINRLEFIDFSWSLDVEPSGDPSSQEDMSKLFNIDSCEQERSHQLELKYVVSSLASKQNEASKLAKVYKTNPNLIKEIFHQKLATQLEISPLNVAHLNIFPLKSDSLLVETKIIELSNGLVYKRSLGFTNYMDVVSSLKRSIISTQLNRHTLDQCKLDSMSESKANVFVFCQGLTLCILIDRDDFSSFIPTLRRNPNEQNLRSRDIKDSECRVEEFDWTPLKRYENNSVLLRVEDNKHKLYLEKMEFKFRYQEEGSAESELVDYKGFVHAVQMVSLDPQGVYESKSVLNNLRYSTIAEEPNLKNMNRMFSLVNGKGDKFKYCRLACQMDNYCESFSVCSRNKDGSIQNTDCILSTIRLTSERINEIDSLLRDFTLNNDNLKLKVTDYENSQEVKFIRENGCSIHSRDNLQSYRMSGVFTGGSGVNYNPNDELKFGTVTTLEDCADQDFEASQWSPVANSNFTYCPMGSLCVLEDDNVENIPKNQKCYSYSRSHSQFYDRRPFTRMSVQLGEESLAHLNEEEKKNERLKIARSIEGLDIEHCARDCNLLQSNCLAFDSCKLSPTLTMCNLYSVRSPNTKFNKLLGYLPQENQFFTQNSSTNNSITLLVDSKCNHFALKDIYFTIRLQQLLAPHESQRQKADNLENSLIDSDQRQGDDLLSNEIERRNSSDCLAKRAQLVVGGGGIHFVLLLFGILFSSMSLLYGSKVATYVGDLVERFRAFRVRRNLEHRISELALANNQDI